ncbi:MAG TPA: ABC transporter ATP-binding protein [Gemmatimonadales bacterium]|nr:ABC transporter ATP-binding protein [Gemmatimonadales bacterium]
MSPVLQARGLTRRFTGGDGRSFTILDALDLDVASGEFVAIVGASGSGKSTLLHLLGGLDRPDDGQVLVEAQDLGTLPPSERAALRNARLGFVFQFHHLLRDFTARENIMMPLLIGGGTHAGAGRRADELLEILGLTPRAHSRTPLLSGGEQQRVALGRALATEPAVLLADEPTGNLDPPTATMLHDLLARLARTRGAATVVVTHNRDLAARADRILTLEEGRLRPAAVGEIL